ncbi:Cytochrome P450 [Ceratobasidium theobromae]|uniref:Cytochrome P450 n=1 Tax=Ceratobasidium theobromae TaxID=1582974 RepID=A0A5N5QHC7_9AGAM|nr:Cytochrome P450 [Ceratobasidium theobromae]
MDLNQLQLLVSRIPLHVRNRPLGYLVTLVAALLARRTFKYLTAPSTYPNIVGPPRKSMIFGHLLDIFSPTNIKFHDALEETYGSVCKVYGILGRENLYVSDPRFLQEVLVKEEDIGFSHPPHFFDVNSASFGPGLASCPPDMHKAQRKMLNPAFTSQYMKARFPQVPTFNAIAQSVGFECVGVERFIHLRNLQMKLAITQDIGGAQSKELDMLRWCSATALELAQAILTQRKASLKDEKAAEELHDIMSILLKANMEASEGDRLPEDQILGQMNTLVFAGHETTSGALARILEVLSQNQSMQDRLRDELLEAPDNMTYDELHSLEYLDAICRETLRLFPPVSFLDREAMEDRMVPLRYPIKGKDGKEIREILVRKGTSIYVALREANRSKETWGEDASEFKPDRWLGRLPNSVSDARTPGVYSSMMTFSAGPRACIGFKFSILELKIVLLTLIKSFKFAPGTAQVEWLNHVTMSPYPLGTKNSVGEGKEPSMPLNVSVL